MAAPVIQPTETISMGSLQSVNAATRSNPGLLGPEGDAAITEAFDHGSASEPNNAVTDQRPTRKYQILLLLSGFVMCFHTIGMNLSYGIFQVSLRTGHVCTLMGLWR